MIFNYWFVGFLINIILFLYNHNEIIEELNTMPDTKKAIETSMIFYWIGVFILSIFSWIFILYEIGNAISFGKKGGLTILKFLFK